MDQDPCYKLEDKRRDAYDAIQRARRYHVELQEIYRHFTPFRQPIVDQASERGLGTEGAKRTSAIFDGTGPSAAFAFVSNMKADWMPSFEPFFSLDNGPLYLVQNKEARREQLQALGGVVHGLTQKIRATVTDEMFSDLFAGTGAMVLRKGTKSDPIRGFAVPTAEIALDNGPWGGVERITWERPWPARQIEQMWPEAKIPPGLATALKGDRNAKVKVTQYTHWCVKSERWRLTVWTDRDPNVALWEDSTKTCPWITPRMFVVPGEAMGRGLAHIGLPFVRTVNKARELALRAAAFALLGLWTRRHDGVFNPDTAAMIPGAMWKVGSNGGALGPTIGRLDIPHNFDISTVIINDERDQIRRVLLDDELPELTDRVRSPTEIAGRMRRYDRNRGGATTRLAYELITPFVQRSVDILGEHRMIPGDLEVDDILTKAVVTAPAAAAQKTDKVERMVSWLQIMAGLVGPQMMGLIAEVEKIMPQMARDLGIDEQFIRKKTEVKMLQQLIDTAVQGALKQQKEMGGAPPPEQAQPEVPPEQQYMNGGF